MNVVLMTICLIGIPYLTGRGIMHLTEKENKSRSRAYLFGSLFLLVVFEITAAVCIRTGQSYHTLLVIYALLAAVLALPGAFLALMGMISKRSGAAVRNRNSESGNRGYSFWFFLPVGIFLLQALIFFAFVPDNSQSATVETVVTTQATNSVFTHNPLTGQLLTAPVSKSGSLRTLPVFYSVLSSLFHAEPAVTVYGVASLWVLCLSYAVMLQAGKFLLEKSGTRRRDLAIFMTVVGNLNLFGDYVPVNPQFHLLQHGYEAITLFVMVLIPCVTLSGMQLVRRNKQAGSLAGSIVGIILSFGVLPMLVSLKFGAIILALPLCITLICLVAVTLQGRRQAE